MEERMKQVYAEVEWNRISSMSGSRMEQNKQYEWEQNGTE